MTTKKLMLIGIAVVLIILTGHLICKYAWTQPQQSSTNSTLREKPLGGKPVNLKTMTTAARATDKVITAEAQDKDKDIPAEAQDKVTLKIEIPKPFPGGTPKDIRSPNLEPDLGGKDRAPLQVPTGTTLLSKGCKVTSSDPEPIIGELAFVTDGNKEHDAANYVELGPQIQWVQIDLGKEKQLYAACIWHYHGESRVYRDIVCQVSNDPDLITGVQTVFNNDHDNSSILGAGTDKEYKEDFKGRPFAIYAVKGRYVRFYSRGNTSNDLNHYTEIELYGKDL